MFDCIHEEPQVLIIDDVKATRDILRDMLAEMGISRVMEATDGDDALQKVKTYGAQLILCDLFMNNMNGLQLIDKLRESVLLQDIPVIVISACGDAPVIDSAFERGADDYLVKPISFKLFQRKISDVLKRRAIWVG